MKILFNAALQRKQDAAFIVKRFTTYRAFNRQIVLFIDPASICLKILCQLLSAWMAFILYLRFFTHIFEKGGVKYTILQMFIAIMATIMPMLEKLMESKVKSPEAYMWSRQILTAIKAMLMMTVFVANGLANDFFIGCSFFFTTTIGYFYFVVNPYTDPAVYLM